MDFVAALRALAPYATLAGLGLIVFYYLFRDVIRKNIFPTVSAINAYRLLRLVLVLTFVIAVSAIGVWLLAGQLTELRRAEMATADRKAAAEKLAAEQRAAE